MNCPVFMLYTERLPDLRGFARCLYLHVRLPAPAIYYIEFMANSGKTVIRHVSPEYAVKLIRNCPLRFIPEGLAL